MSLLEVNAQSLQIQDEEGKNRFKSGFFADAFRDYNFINRNLFSKYIENDKGEKIPSIPIPISSNFLSKNKIKGKAPSLGQDNKTLLS